MPVLPENYSLIPTWSQVKETYPYKPSEAGAKRAESRLKKAFEKEAKKNDELWDPELLTDRSQLPDRNLDILFSTDIGAETELAKDLKRKHPTFAKAVNFVASPGAYVQAAADRPQNLPEGVISAIYNGIGDWFSKDEADAADTLEYSPEFLAWQNGGGAGAGGGYDALAGTPFPSIAGYAPNWAEIRKAQEAIKAPQYREKAFNPMNTVANMLMNMDWINMDMSKAGKIMQDAFNRRADDNAEVANKTEEAKYNAARQNLATALALEELRAKAASQNAQLAIARWQANQPKALGGNKMYWRDSQGNLHFEAVDKEGEARTLGSNEAMSDLMSMDANKLRKMTPKQIAQMAERKALMLGDNKAQVPFRQGYIILANQLKANAGEK